MTNLMLMVAGIGTTELVVITGALLLFGGRKIPEFIRGPGKGINAFKKGKVDITNVMNILQFDDTH